jgi:hypothetical protein
MENTFKQEEIAPYAKKVWVLWWLVSLAQKGLITFGGSRIFQHGVEKHQWPLGVANAAKVAMCVLSFGQKKENVPSDALLEYVGANWRRVVDFAFHPPTASQGVLGSCHDLPFPYPPARPVATCSSPTLAPPPTPPTFGRTLSHESIVCFAAHAQEFSSSHSGGRQPETVCI